MKRLSLTIASLIIAVAVIAQGNQCPTFERAAIAEARIWCANIETGHACYGNSGVTADVISDVPFSTVGDSITLSDITQIETLIDQNRYGIALLQTTGYAPDSWIPQPVSIVLLGDVTIANTGNENINLTTLDAEIVGAQGANVRTGPSTDFRIITSLFEGELIKVTGRADDGSFYRVHLPSGEAGWIAAGAIEADVSDVPVVTTEDTIPETIYAPYTSFSLETGSQDAACDEVWESGVLVQSPVESEIRLAVNDIPVIVQGTVFVQSQETTTTFFIIEGELNSNDELAEEGYSLSVVADEVRVAPYEFERFAPLPTEILPRYTYIGIDLSTILTPSPELDRSPIADVLVDDPCVITTGETGANLRAGPGSEFLIRGVLAFRETVNPIGRTTGSDGALWWELAQNIWVSSQVVVTGGDCVSVPQSDRIPVPLPTATPEN